ncbi:NACHT domain-containing protein [Amycolatopsis sp. RTGN1]|uniref:NACHT domain-containing protein n=1 Tax=Amycolatopsis ponsaeliensis TaxID=2992142 RepID=UPI00254E19EE|nr:NACHT domain-containing protein [Amycolatopsis sp. RTGN1]
MVLINHSLEENDSYSSIAATLIAIGTTIFAVMAYLRRREPVLQLDQEADSLVGDLLEQWAKEIRDRRQRFGGSQAIPLCWAAARTGAVRLKLDGKLTGNPDDAADTLAREFERIPGRRLVVLGEPGSGKTFLSIMLTVGLLRRASTGIPVPVFLSMSSWDPVTESLDDWLVRSLAAGHYGGQERIPRSLLTRQLLLPILDGLDELPQHLRRRAIGRINDTLDGNRPIVMTCRSVEYADELAGGAPALLRAPVVEIQPVAQSDILAELTGNPAWQAVATDITRNPTSPIAAALSTPLMLSLFKVAYDQEDPAELLDATTFGSRHAVEDQLIDLLVEAVYQVESPGRSWWRRRWSADRSRAWLTYLARYMHAHGERDFAWWRLADRTLSPWTASVIGVAAGISMFFLAFLVNAAVLPDLTHYDQDPVTQVMYSPPAVGIIFGIVVSALWLAGARRAPDSSGPLTHSQKSGLARGAITGGLLVLFPGLLLWSISFNSANLTDQVVVTQTALAGALLALSLVAALAVGMHELITSRTAQQTRPDPNSLLRQDRRSTLVAALATGLVSGTASVLAATGAAALAGYLGQRIALTLDLPTVVELHLPPVEEHVPWRLTRENLPVLIVASIFLAILFAVAVLTTRAWPRFFVARFRLASMDALPWTLLTFLEDARKRGLLRVAGGTYQFWHVRLQERLVNTAAAPRQARRRQAPYIIAATALLLIPAAVFVLSQEPPACGSSGSETADKRMSRMVVGDISACYVILKDNEWPDLSGDPTDRAAEIQIKSGRQVGKGSYDQAAVLGHFDQLAPGQWHEVLEGMIAAQSADKRPLTIKLIYSTTGTLGPSDANRLSVHFLSYQDYNESLPLSGITLERGGSSITARTSTYTPLVLGVQPIDFPQQVHDYVESTIADWTHVEVSELQKPDNLDLRNGVTDDECESLKRERETSTLWRFDLRTTQVSPELLKRIGQCGNVAVLLNEDQTAAYRELQQELPTVSLLHVSDESAAIASSCEFNLGKPVPLRTATCLGVLAAGKRFGISLNPVVVNS